MIIKVLDQNFKVLENLHDWEFLQYNNPSRDIGEFTINVHMNEYVKKFINTMNNDRDSCFYFMFEDGYVAKLEDITKSDGETQNVTVKLHGRNVLFILTKRVVQGTINFSGKTANLVKTLIEMNLTNEGLGNRRINATVILDDEEYLLSQCSDIEKQITGGYVWDEVQTLLEQDKLGISLLPVSTEKVTSEGIETNIESWEFHITAGVDRTKGNIYNNKPVLFSQSLSNLYRTSYTGNNKNYCCMAYVAGEGEGEERKWFEIYTREESEYLKGFDRSELWVDARDVQSTDTEGNEISEEEYGVLIENRAGEKLSDAEVSVSYSATISQNGRLYEYGKDYYRTDMCTVEDKELNVSVNVQILDVTTSVQNSQKIVDVTFLYGSLDGDPIRKIKKNEQSSEQNSVNIKYVESRLLKVMNGDRWESGSFKPYPTTNGSNNMNVIACRVGKLVSLRIYSLLQFPNAGHISDLDEVVLPEKFRPREDQYISCDNVSSGSVVGSTRWIISNKGKISCDTDDSNYKERMGTIVYEAIN